mmetsp:Transcript_28261/g.68769  ORF Transcript_28261/g.68769 Transcript_28261/m.68769 type:complete len:166 (+) Transcript_28261:99-596(+)
MMNASDNAASHISAEEGNSKSQQDSAETSDEECPNNDQMSHTPEISNSEYTSDPVKSTHQQQEDVIAASVKFDPENPMPFFLAKEAKYAAFAGNGGSNHEVVEEYRVADVENLLSYKSIFCWVLLTVLLVGGSLWAFIVTVDWDATANDGGDADVMNNSTIAGAP